MNVNLFLWSIFGLAFSHSYNNMGTTLEVINIYFNHRNINNLNIYACTLGDGEVFFRELVNLGFMVRIEHVLIEKKNSIPSNIGWFVDLSCIDNLDFYRNISGFDGAWLGFPASSPNLNLSNLRLDSDVVVGTENGILWDMYAKPSGVIQFIEAGTWHPPMVEIPNRKHRYDLEGVVLRGVLVELELEFYKNNITNKIGDHDFFPELETTERLSYVYFKNVAVLYNFQIEFVPADTWGYGMSNGTFAGMVGVVNRGEADFGVTSCAFRQDRMDGVAYSHNLQTVRFVSMFTEERYHGNHLSLLLPFSFHLWLTIFVVLIIGAAMFSVIQKRDVTEGIIFVTAILAQQVCFIMSVLLPYLIVILSLGLENEAQKTSARVYSISLLLLGLVLYSYYNAAIMNGLLSPAPPTIRTELDLLKSNLKAIIARVPYLIPPNNQKAYINSEMLAKAYESNQDLIDVFVGLDKLRHESMILISDDLALYAVINDKYNDPEKCNLREFETIRPLPLGNPLHKNSPFKEMLAQGLLLLQENGLAERDRNVWYPPKPHCFGTTIFQHVTLEAVGLAFSVYTLGILLSFFILFTEILIKKVFKFNRFFIKHTSNRAFPFIR